MKVLIASSGGPGHSNPLLSMAGILARHNHEVVVQTSEELRPIVEAAKVPFISEVPEANTFVGGFVTKFPEREMTGFDLEHFFARLIPVQAAGLELALRDFPADVVLADSWYWGTLPM